ncbi:MAG: NAD(P)H-dependent oxidoreductase [Chthoniobacterales bacterium]
MQTITADTLLASLNWRYATKNFDSTRKVRDADWAALEQSLILTPSSFGLQPWKFIIITDQAVKDSLVPVSWGQRQLADASHVVVFAVKTELEDAHVHTFIEHTAAARGVPVESLAGYRNVILNFIADPPFGLTVKDWITRQAYIALGNLMTSAALLGIDTCPMEGFDPAKYDEILGLNTMGLRSVVTCTVGYRAASDKYAAVPKVRFPASEVVLHI